VPQLVEIDSDQGFAIAGVRARQAVALDDGARPFGRDFKALADLRVSELLELRLVAPERVGLPCCYRCPWLVTRRTRGYAKMVDGRLKRSAGGERGKEYEGSARSSLFAAGAHTNSAGACWTR